MLGAHVRTEGFIMIRIWATFVTFALSLGAQSTGAISGVLTNEGHPVARASITAYFQGMAAKGVFPAPVTAVTGDDGSFRIGGVPAGLYRLCAEKGSAALLNPCQWSSAPPTVMVSSGQESSIDITAQTGIWTHIRVDDPSGLLSSNPMLDDLLVTVKTDSGAHLPAMRERAERSGQTLKVLVPQGIPVNVKIYSARLSLLDNEGHSFTGPNSTVRTAVSASIQSATAPILTVTVRGRRN